MAITSSTDGNKYTIKIQGRFDFGVQAEFRQLYEKEASSSAFVLDFSLTDYMDSSALGMLLLLRDYAGGDNAEVELVQCKPDIRNILEISNFQKLFKIS
ncbi:MAG: anti-anti-sigma factor [Gammaproteobacteria bacterium]|nr:MAG: anti-anti-sigma factor [Gammaproteobacteria bacterium]